MSAGTQPCRHPLFGALGQFLDDSGYCITQVACKASRFLVPALVKVTDIDPAAPIWLYYNRA
jgi:hypothetical protein